MAPYDLLRFSVFGVVLFSAAVALGDWALRTRRINPFGRAARIVRRVTDPVLSPFETWLLRRGGNPQNAGWWLLGVGIVGGILLLSATQWLVVQAARASSQTVQGPRGLARLMVYYASQLILLALIARVIGSWFGVGRYNRWMRPAYVLTDWLVRPLRRVVPPIGMVDITPIVAWFLLLVVRSWILSVL